jgi:hypothetical protein
MLLLHCVVAVAVDAVELPDDRAGYLGSATGYGSTAFAAATRRS